MKILFVQPTGDKKGHYGVWSSKLCHAIGKQQHELQLITNKIYPEKFLKEEPAFKIKEVKEGYYRFDKYDTAIQKKSLTYWYGYFRNTYFIVKEALSLCKKEQFDAIFLTDVEYLVASILIKYYKHPLPPIIWHVQAANFTYDTYVGSRFKKMYKTFQREIFKSILGKKIKGFAVLGEFHKQKIREQLKLTEQFPITHISDGADDHEQLISRLEARKLIKLHTNETTFLFLGMLRKDKGIQYLIEAVSLLKTVQCKVVIAGAPFEWREKELTALIDQYDVANQIELRLTYISDEEIPYYYAACDVVIFPYLKDYSGGCGPLTKGACTYGKPVIVSDVADMGRLTRENQNGLVAEANNVHSLAEKMTYFLKLSHAERQIMSQHALALAKKCSWDHVAKQLTDFLSSQ